MSIHLHPVTREKITQVEYLKATGFYGSTKDPEWDPETKTHKCCGSPRAYYHRRDCPLCNDI